MDGSAFGRPRIAIAMALVLAVGTAGLVTRRGTPASTSADVLDDPPVVVVDQASMRTLDGLPDDGLNRFVIALDPDGGGGAEATVGATPTEATASASESADDVDGPTVTTRDEDRFARPTEISEGDLDLLEALGGGGATTAPGPSAPATVGSAAPTPAGGPVDLAGIDGITSVTPAGPGFVAVTTTLSAAQVQSIPGVAEVEADDLRVLHADYYRLQWGHRNLAKGADIRWEEARALATGDGVVVAVIDSGVDLDHPDLASSWWRNTRETCGNGIDDDRNGYVDDCTGWDFAGGDATVDDADADNTHGTHVAGIIAAADNRSGTVGVAPGARVMPLKIFHNGASSSSRLAAAVSYAIDNGADVINLSLGGDQGSFAEFAAIRRASAAGIPVVVASGNSGRDVDVRPSYPAAYDLPTLIAVGSSDDDDRRSRFSNYGARGVDLFAPGNMILSTVPGGLAYMSGTSMSAPYVSGGAALVVEQGLTGAAVRTRLIETVKPAPDLETRSLSGGRLDSASAVGLPRGSTGVPDVEFASFHDLVGGQPDVASVWITVDPAGLPSEGVVVRGTLGIIEGDTMMGIVRQPVRVGDGVVTTDDAAQFLLTSTGGLSGAEVEALASGLELPFSTDILSGHYALAVEVLAADDLAAGPLAPPSVVFFRVAEQQATPAAPLVVADPSEPPLVPPAPGPEAQPAPGTPGAGGPVPAPSTGATPPAASTGSPSTDGPSTDSPSTDSPSPGGTSTTGPAPVGGGGGTVVGAPLAAPTGGPSTGPTTGPTTSPGTGHATGPVSTPPTGSVSAPSTPSSGTGPSTGAPAPPPPATGTTGTATPGAVASGTATTTSGGTPAADAAGKDKDKDKDKCKPKNGNAWGNTIGNGNAYGHDKKCTGVGAVVGDVTQVVDGVVEDIAVVVDGVIGGGPTPGPTEDVVIEGTVQPSSGTPAVTAVTVIIPGGIPTGAQIRFGDRDAPITSRLSPTSVVVSPPAHAPGAVDVAVVFDGVRRHIPRAYTFLAAEGGAGGAPATDPTAPGEVPAVGGGAGQPAPAPGAIPTSPGAPSVSGPGSPPVSGLPGTVGGSQPTPTPSSGPTTGPTTGLTTGPGRRGPHLFNGVWVDDLPPGSPLAGIPASRVIGQPCRQERCGSRARP